jgi:hydrogenase maturation protease
MIDFGIRGIELAYTLLEGYDTLILIDATPRGNEPGTLYLIDPDLCDMDMRRGVEAGRSALDAHSMDPLKVLSFARTLGAVPRQTFLVGCEPSPVVGGGPDTEMQIGLSPAVHLALAGAVKMIDALVAKLLRVEA